MEEQYSNALAILQDLSTAARLRTCGRLKYFRRAQRATAKWPFDQFRQALENTGSEGWQAESRWQILNAWLNGIRRAVNKCE